MKLENKDNNFVMNKDEIYELTNRMLYEGPHSIEEWKDAVMQLEITATRLINLQANMETVIIGEYGEAALYKLSRLTAKLTKEQQELDEMETEEDPVLTEEEEEIMKDIFQDLFDKYDLE